MRSEVNSAAYRFPYLVIRGIIENKEVFYLWIVNAYQKIGESQADKKFRFDFVEDL
jgi:hypothetical protein